VERAQLERTAKNAWDQAPKILRHPSHVYNGRNQAGRKPACCGSVLRNVVGDDSGGLLRNVGLRLDQTVFEPQAENPLKNMVAGPGFEPVPPAASKNLQVLKVNDFKGFRKRKSA
jgi:hypothetical protein